MRVLSARGLHKQYGRVRAVVDVHLEVSRGEVLGILGPNGAGKSTVFRMLAGVERPDAGCVLLGEEDVTDWPLHQRARAGLAYLPQHATVFPRLSARDNVELVGVTSAQAEALLDVEGLLEVADRPAGELSGGQRRRLEIARCLALRPRVVLLDEPFAGVDPIHVAELKTRIRALAAADLAVVLTDHSVADALGVVDRALVLNDGVRQLEGSPSEIASHQSVRERYLGSDFRL